MDAGVPGSRLRFVGVGLGPGDPALLTVKAVRELQAADVVLVPQTERSRGGAGRAERIIGAACPAARDRIRRVGFAMREPDGRDAARAAAATAALTCFDEGARVVVMATIGDPSVYSTFAYLAERVRDRRADVRIEVVPGITAMQAMAAAAVVPLVVGDQALTLVPATAGLDTLAQALDSPGVTVAAYKGGRRLPEIRDLIERRGRLDGALVGTDVGLPSARIERLADVDTSRRAPYFSTVLCPATDLAAQGPAPDSADG